MSFVGNNTDVEINNEYTHATEVWNNNDSYFYSISTHYIGLSVCYWYSYADKYVLCLFAENRSQGYGYNPWTEKCQQNVDFFYETNVLGPLITDTKVLS